MLAIGILAGYGGRKVFIWLDHQVARLFKITKEKAKKENFVKVPDLSGMTKEDAETKLAELSLGLGKVTSSPTKKRAEAGRVIGQGTKPDLSLAAGELVDITVGIEDAG